MSEETRDFWENEFAGINMDGIGPVSKLSQTDRKVIREMYEALRGREKYVGICVLGHINIKKYIIEFSSRLGATEREIELDILPSLGL